VIPEPLPPELGLFVEQQLASGKYHSEQELVVDAVRVLCEEVQLGIGQLDRGEATEYSMEQLRERFDQLKDRARRRIAGDEAP
jgi:Arc/MetJ-type ribon-helix-helix transcriptional regulator